MSGNADPRTATTLILFEEFVPYEYRQQLAESGNTRRRLPSLFGTKKQQWKPATTLNGRPYVVGHVPTSPSYREAEFEGLLRSNGSSTRVLSLKTSPAPDRLPTGYSSIMTSPVSTATSPVQAPKAPFLSPFPRAETPIERSSSRASDVESPTPITSPSRLQTNLPPSTPSSSSANRKSRFRLPVTPNENRTAGLPPAEYETVDFEARLASFDDDDLALPSRSKHSRRQSKDDAWVDILVANNNRRIAGQDVERRNGLKSGRSDPELASQELSEVMAAVHQVHSDDEEEDMEPVSLNGHHIDDAASEATTNRQETDADQLTIPGPSTSTYDLSDEEEPVPRVTPRKRMGYFDLHPERRTPLTEHHHEDFRAESPAVPAASFDDARLHFERQSMYEDPRSVFERPSMDSQPDMIRNIDEDDNEEAYAAIAPTSVLPTRDDSRGATPSPVPKVDVSPPPPPPSEPEPVKPLNVTPKSQSKTASLIELYREKERGGTSPSSPATPSKLPLRTGASLSTPSQPIRPISPATSPSSSSTPSPSVVAPVAAPVPAPAPVPATVHTSSLPSPAPSPTRQLEDDYVPESKLYHDDVSSLQLPIRYVHGAPLHNVLEEEEEEEE